MRMRPWTTRSPAEHVARQSTVRESIRSALLGGPVTTRDLSQVVGIPDPAPSLHFARRQSDGLISLFSGLRRSAMILSHHCEVSPRFRRLMTQAVLA